MGDRILFETLTVVPFKLATRTRCIDPKFGRHEGKSEG